MSTFREIVYLILDELKLSSDDSYFTEDHIIYLVNNYRTFLLKQRYSDIKKSIPSSNYQEICLTLEEVEAKENSPCTISFNYKKSTKQIPSLLSNSNTRVYSEDYFDKEFPIVGKDRMKYIGYNKFLSKVIYASVASNDYLYLKSSNDNLDDIVNIKLYGVFHDAVEASKLACKTKVCNGSTCQEIDICDILDQEYPLETALIPQVVQLVVAELKNSIYAPKDPANNADDDLDEVQLKK